MPNSPTEGLDNIEVDSKYLRGIDLMRGDKWSQFSLTVESVGEKDSMQAEDGKVIEGYPVYFKQTKKILVLNKTNTKLAITAMGSKSKTDWVGKTLHVYPSVLSRVGNKTNVLCLRVRVPSGVPAPHIEEKLMGRDLTQEHRS